MSWIVTALINLKKSEHTSEPALFIHLDRILIFKKNVDWKLKLYNSYEVTQYLYIYIYLDIQSKVSIHLPRTCIFTAVFSSNDFFSSHFSVLEWVEHIHENIHKVWFNNEFIIGLLKLWPTLWVDGNLTATVHVWIFMMLIRITENDEIFCYV